MVACNLREKGAGEVREQRQASRAFGLKNYFYV